MGNTTTILRLTFALCAIGSLAACGEEPRPPSVQEFMDDPILLDATMVRCVANRDSVSYDPECVTAREAVERIATAEEEARQAALEAESERKREALRSAQEAADEARRQAAEAQRLREEAELLGLLPATPEGTVAESEELSFIEIDDGEAAATVTAQDVPVPGQKAPVPAQGVPVPVQKAPVPAQGVPVPVQKAPVPAPAVVPAHGVVEAGSGLRSPAGSQPPPVTTDLAEIREQLEQRQPTPPPETSNHGL